MTVTTRNSRMFENPALKSGRYSVSHPEDPYEQVPADDAFVRFVDMDGRVVLKHTFTGDPQHLVPMGPADFKKFTIKQEAPWINAPDLEQIGHDLLEMYPELAPARRVNICFTWERKGGKEEGYTRYEKAVRLGADARILGGFDYRVWLAADHIRAHRVRAIDVEAMLFHALLHVRAGQPKSHEFFGFTHEFNRYGAWRHGLRVAAVTAHQMELLPSDTDAANDIDITERVQEELKRVNAERPAPPWMSVAGAMDDDADGDADEGDEG